MLWTNHSLRAPLTSTLRLTRHASNKPYILDTTAEMMSQLGALQAPGATDSWPPASGPKPNALQDHPEEEPIPPLPAPIKGWPTPWITEHDVLHYVYPLYTRGWGQSLKLWKPTLPKATSAVNATTGPGKATERDIREWYTMLFSARYKFRDYDSAVQFFIKLAEIAKGEKHHPSVLIANGNPLTVTVATQTDSAKRPIWAEEQQQPTDPPSTSPPQVPLKIPGLTLRDIRLATLAENIYSTHFASHLSTLGRNIYPSNFRLSWAAMERTWKGQVLLSERGTRRRDMS